MTAFTAMLPRLDAEERLAAINDRSIAAGAMEPVKARRMIRRLEQAARGGAPRRAPRATPAVLEAMGVPVREVPSEGSQKALSDG
ncbi:hypothetical protein [Sphingobium lignivorans]|uniref:Uncharacterized protein n=1 Tax=Sphingobium lignivorans TaxID=2735886 RepID=A0ABR6NJH7_9SPHN|nr:hypothetical protein [Sphingobium lignivorans]MBB5987435.1 hypothetical protein [Sphingobium lignivorans]